MNVIPLWGQLLIAAAIGVGLYATGHYNGADGVQKEWNASVERGKAIVSVLKQKAETITTVTEYKTVTVEKVIHEKGDTIYKLRESFVPTDSGMLPGSFRLFYDAAITNTIPDPSGIANAAPIAVADIADTHAYNAEQCNIAYAKYDKWREWATEQCALNPKGCPPNGQ